MKLSEDTSLRFVTKIGETVGGPYSIEGLESLVYLKKITPDTLVAIEGTDEFIAIRDSTLTPILFPGLLEKRDSTPQEWSAPGMENDPEFINRKRFRTTEAKFENINEAAGDLPKVDVYEILDEIRQTEIETGADLPRPDRFRISKRGIDFWIMVIVGNAVILGASIYLQNTASMVFGIAGSGLYTFGLLWSMFGVMDNY